MASTSVKLVWDESVQAYRMSTPYNINFLELLKRLIPVSDRNWDPDHKIWTITEPWAMPVKNLCESMWGSGVVQFLDRHAVAQAQAAAQAAYQAAQNPHAQAQYHYVPPASSNAVGMDAVMLTFVKVLPFEAALSAYRKAATELHPDKNGGDDSKMTALNAAWTSMKKDFYKRT